MELMGSHLNHEFEQRDGKWWCVTENVISDECHDEGRCEYGCVCNKTKRYAIGMVYYYEADNYAHAEEQFLDTVLGGLRRTDMYGKTQDAILGAINISEASDVD